MNEKRKYCMISVYNLIIHKWYRHSVCSTYIDTHPKNQQGKRTHVASKVLSFQKIKRWRKTRKRRGRSGIWTDGQTSSYKHNNYDMMSVQCTWCYYFYFTISSLCRFFSFLYRSLLLMLLLTHIHPLSPSLKIFNKPVDVIIVILTMWVIFEYCNCHKWLMNFQKWKKSNDIYS